MARKITRKGLRNKLDKLVSEIVRKRSCCEHCGSKENPQAAHCFSRTYLNTRWDIENNVFRLCASCHFYFHKNPIYFTEWVRNYLGEDKYNLLKEAHNIIYKPTIEDLQLKLKILEELKGGKNG